MDHLIEKKYCQSCGMPLRFDVEAWLGTNSDQSLCDEYCYYCLKGGQYIVDISMGEMVDIWVKYTGKYNEYADTNYTPQQLRMILNKRLPTLKRWKQKEETYYIHHDAISRIKTHIDQNLFRQLEPKMLGEMANLSLFHFRRVFKTVTGENIGTYIQRLRLEYIAHLLIATDWSAGDILKQTNYQTKFGLSKAFRMHFGIPMSTFRSKYKISSNTLSNQFQDSQLKPLIKRINTQKVLGIPIGDAFRNEQTYYSLWKKLIDYRKKQMKHIAGNQFVSISQDNPAITRQQQCRFHIGITVEENIKPEAGFIMQEIPGGMYAIFNHTGNYAELPELYRKIFEEWIPQNNYYQKYPLTFEIYLNSPKESAIDELLTEIYIPVGHLAP